MIPWAEDAWWGEDKLTHAVWCYAGALTCTLFGWPLYATVLGVGLAGVVVEVVQWVRYDDERPTFAAPPSYRDLAWDGVGLVLGLIVGGL